MTYKTQKQLEMYEIKSEDANECDISIKIFKIVTI